MRCVTKRKKISVLSVSNEVVAPAKVKRVCACRTDNLILSDDTRLMYTGNGCYPCPHVCPLALLLVTLHSRRAHAFLNDSVTKFFRFCATPTVDFEGSIVQLIHNGYDPDESLLK